MAGLPVHHQLPKFTQTHVNWVSDAIQHPHTLLFPSPPALNLSHNQGLFQWVSSSHQVAKVLQLQLQHQSLWWKRPWCWERLKAGGEGDHRGWDGWMSPLTRWTWVWASSGSWWWTWNLCTLQSMRSQKLRQLTEWLNRTDRKANSWRKKSHPYYEFLKRTDQPYDFL